MVLTNTQKGHLRSYFEYVTDIDEQGRVAEENYFIVGERLHHRVGGPAQVKREWHANGVLAHLDEAWRLMDRSHRVGGPASLALTWDDEGNELHRHELWGQLGKSHREDGPAHVTSSWDGGRREEWYIDGERHREGAAAEIKSSAYLLKKQLAHAAATGIDVIPDYGVPLGVHVQNYYRHGTPHREDGPAQLEIGIDGRAKFERWMINGLEHRDGDQPSSTRRWPGGQLWFEHWCQYGKLHRENGPALIGYRTTGEIMHWSYYDHGKRLERPDRAPGAPSCDI